MSSDHNELDAGAKDILLGWTPWHLRIMAFARWDVRNNLLLIFSILFNFRGFFSVIELDELPGGKGQLEVIACSWTIQRYYHMERTMTLASAAF